MTIINYKNVDEYLQKKKCKIDFNTKDLIDFKFFLKKNTNSSYKDNNFYKIFIYLSNIKRPETLCELGVLGCYSLLSIAYGQKLLHENNKRYSVSFGYDLFEDYEFNSFKLTDAKKIVNKIEFNNYVTLEKYDIFNSGILDKIKDFEFIHIDLSNHGEILEQVFERLNLNNKKIIIIEGGGLERDQIKWMIKYKKKSIFSFLKKLDSSGCVKIDIINDFPSISIIEYGG